MAKTFSLEIVTTDRIFYKGECEHLVITAIDGLLGILAGHEPLVTALPAGELKYMVDGKWRYAAISDGFIQVMPDKSVILADSCELPEEIDIDGLEIDLGKMMKDRSAAMFADFDPKDENAAAPYPYQVTKLLKVKNVTVTDGKRWMFFRSPALFKDLKVEGACPGYPPR